MTKDNETFTVEEVLNAVMSSLLSHEYIYTYDEAGTDTMKGFADCYTGVGGGFEPAFIRPYIEADKEEMDNAFKSIHGCSIRDAMDDLNRQGTAWDFANEWEADAQLFWGEGYTYKATGMLQEDGSISVTLASSTDDWATVKGVLPPNTCLITFAENLTNELVCKEKPND